jgi:hypothetical protein
MSVDMVNNNRLLLKSCDNLPIYNDTNKWFLYHFFFIYDIIIIEKIGIGDTYG